MTSLRDQIDEIKSKIKLSEELSKHIQLVPKGNDLWSLCFFHNEKTPSMKINDELSSYYCFGCGAKGDLITFYTDYLNYSFKDALKELAGKAGIRLNFDSNLKNLDIVKRKKIYEIFQLASEWFHKNLYLKENVKSLKYFKKRNISENTIKFFKLGYSSSSSFSLFEYLKKRSFSEKDLLETSLFKEDKNKNIRDFFYKRLIFPICDTNSRVIAFGARSLDESEPKYINSSESDFFKKRNLLYNLNKAKIIARKKKNLLICEGYMDVISLSDKDINSVVSPLGTAITQEQLMLAWKVCKIPTIMFDGDLAGKKASIKSALLALKLLKPGFSLQFLEMSKNEDPDSLINNLSKKEFINFLKSPKTLSDYIFDYARESFNYQTPDQKIIFDKYFDDISNLIQNKKVKFFYKNEFKNKLFYFFSNKKTKTINRKDQRLNDKVKNLAYKELLSFIGCYINHPSIRIDLIEDISNMDFFDPPLMDCFKELSKKEKLHLSSNDLINSINNEKVLNIMDKSLNIGIYQLFPYSSSSYNSQEALIEIKKSLKIIETRLSNSAELDKSIKDFKSEKTLLKWKELKKLSYDYISEIE